MKLDLPSPARDVDEDGNFAREWIKFLSRVRDGFVWRTQSGPTADRPTSGLEIGTTFFDTSLGAHGKPIWCSQVTPAVVWVDATSTIV